MNRLASISAVAIVMLTAGGLGALRSTLRAQSPPATPPATFEVASVKPSDPNPSNLLASIPMVMPLVGGRFSATNVTVRLLIQMAYGMQAFRIIGGPSWLASERFDIVAKTEAGFSGTAQDALPMVEALLADRFKLSVHTETRDLPIYALVVARGDGRLGPDLKPSTADCSNAQAEAQKLAEAVAKGGLAAAASLLPKPGETRTCTIMPAMGQDGFGMRAVGIPIAMLTALLTQATGRTVQDETMLTGLYDWTLTFDPQVLLQMAGQAGVNLPPGVTLPPSDSPSLLTAIQEQLGLKLDSRRGPVEVVVIDSAERPLPD